MTNLPADRRGVVLKPREWHVPTPRETHVEPRWSEAYLMAMANKHRPWARRWLKQHGIWP